MGRAGPATQVPQRAGLRPGDPADRGRGAPLLHHGVPVPLQRHLERSLRPGLPAGAGAGALPPGIRAERAHVALADRLLRAGRAHGLRLGIARGSSVRAAQRDRRGRAPYLGGGGAARGLLLRVRRQRERLPGEVSVRWPRPRLRGPAATGALPPGQGVQRAGPPEGAQGPVTGQVLALEAVGRIRSQKGGLLWGAQDEAEISALLTDLRHPKTNLEWLLAST